MTEEELRRQALIAQAQLMQRTMSGGETVMNTPDGGRVVRGEGGKLSFVSPSYSTSDPEAINRIMRGQNAGQLAKAGAREAIIAEAPVAARLTKMVEGVPFVGSYVDEAIGAVAGPEATAGVRALSGAMQEQRPIQSMGLGLGGAALGTVGALAAAPISATGLLPAAGTRALPALGKGLLGGAAAGAMEGAIYGAGQGTDAASRGESAATGGLIGGALGGVLGGAAPYLAKGAENVIGLFRRSDVAKIAKEFGISENAAKLIKSTFDQGGDIAAARQAILRAGDEGMLADAGYAAQALLDAAAATGARPAAIVREAVDSRMARTGQALDAALDQSLGPAPLGPRTAVEAIAKKTEPERALAYRTAYDSPIDYAAPQGQRIEEVMGRIAPDDLIAGITEANKEMLSRGEVNRQILASLDENGNVRFLREMPNVRQLDEIKKALQKLAYERHTDQFGRLTGTGQRYARLAGELRDATADAVPSYGAAVQIGGDKLAEERAFEFGRSLLSPNTEIEDIGFELGRKPSQAQIEAAKSGLRSYIDKVVGDVRAVPSDPNLDARQVVKAVTDMSSDNARAKIKQLMGKEADALLSQVDQSMQSAVVRAAMAANSRTAIRQSIKQTADEIMEPGVIGKALSSEPVNASKKIVQAITGQTAEYTALQRQQLFQDVARALTEKKGQTAVAALNYLEKALQGQPLTAAQNEFLARQIAGSSIFAGYTAAQEARGR